MQVSGPAVVPRAGGSHEGEAAPVLGGYASFLFHQEGMQIQHFFSDTMNSYASRPMTPPMQTFTADLLPPYTAHPSHLAWAFHGAGHIALSWEVTLPLCELRILFHSYGLSTKQCLTTEFNKC